jgi:hypothetical protein
LFTPRRSLVALALAMSAVFVVACGSDSTGNTDLTDFVGSYDLTSVNSQNLPFTLPAFEGTDSVSITSGTLTVGTGVWEANLSLRVVAEGQAVTVAQPVGGTYTQSGNDLTLTSVGEGENDVVQGTISGSTITVHGVGLSDEEAGAGDSTTYTLLFTKHSS